MAGRTQTSAGIRSALTALALTVACAVPQRTFDEDLQAPDDDAPAAAEPSELCSDYCSDTREFCTDDRTVYRTDEGCLAICELLESAPADSAASGLIECRATIIEKGVEPESSCLISGPTGREHPGDKAACGDPCATYCQLYTQLCDEKLKEAECLRQCAAVPDVGGYHLDDNYEGDSIQCRLVHLEAATIAPEGGHCEHARIASPAKCNDQDGPASCEDYCRTVGVACVGEQAVYPSDEACLAACQALDLGTDDDIAENTVGCRHYHAYSALALPAFHCPHAGPSGDGHCGGNDPDGPSGNCVSYCALAAEACGDEFAAEFGDEASCMSTCETWAGAPRDRGFSVENENDSSHTVQCRILKAVAALTTKAAGDEVTGCSAVFTGAPCE